MSEIDRLLANGSITDGSGYVVYPQELTKYLPYNNFRGGKLLTIFQIEAVEKKQGHGTFLMNRIKEQGYGLIHALVPDDAVGFYEKNDFINTGLRHEDTGWNVLTWCR